SDLNRLFKPTKASINQVFSTIQSLTSQIHPITIQLQKHKHHLTKHLQFLHQLYHQNKTYFHNLTLYILPPQKKKKQIFTQTIP
ncbi:toxic anion resistance protein, partial [Staphylococcus epidermidis]|uniref:toxic anion resistance protein n=1 Tax=Staphylococcus epidermidis TaxID=1282 RepID=UPI0016430470